VSTEILTSNEEEFALLATGNRLKATDYRGCVSTSTRMPPKHGQADEARKVLLDRSLGGFRFILTDFWIVKAGAMEKG